MSGKAIRETLGVHGLWGLERLERKEISTPKLALVVTTGSVIIYYLLIALFVGGVPGRENTSLALFFGVYNGLVLFFGLALARWTQADLESLLPIAPEIEPSLGLLRPTWRLFGACIAFEAIVWVGIIHFGVIADRTTPIADVLRFWATPDGFFFAVILPLTLAWVGGVTLLVIIRQVKALTYAARHIDIDILELDHYPRLANPLIRFVMFAFVLLSFAPWSSLLGGADDALVVGLPPLVLILASLVAAYAYPVWLLRGRIRAAKDDELDCVFRSLRGDEGAMLRSRIRHRAGALSFSELLDYRIFIESLWDWPVAPHLQKVVLIGLLPPTTWVLAALIENAVTVVVAAG